MRRAGGLIGLVLVVLAIAYVAAWRTMPVTSRPASQQAAASRSSAVTSITRSCPPPGPNTGTAHIAMIAMPSAAQSAKPGQTPTGTVALNAVPAAAVPSAPATGKKKPTATSTAAAGKQPSATPSATAQGKQPTAAAKPTASGIPPAQPVAVTVPGTPATVEAPQAPKLGGTAVAASGLMAEGFEAEQADASGMGTVSCTHPGSDMWFVGTGAAAGAPVVRLYLMNTGDMAASADVTILTDAGLQDGLGSAITVAPRQVVATDMTPFIHGSEALALHVQTTSGQVSASVWEGDAKGAWLPQAAAPSNMLVIPGLTVASSAARLFVSVPGANDARVKVVAFTAQGRFPQFGSAPIDAPAGATSSFPLTSLGASAAALELISNVPITAGVLVPGEGIGSFTTAVAPVREQGVVAGNPAARGLSVGLVLTAPVTAVRANITVIPAGAGGVAAEAGGTPQLATVPAGHTVAVAVPRPQGSRQPFAIVITPLAGSGPLYAARVVTSGTGGLSAPLLSLLPVPSALTAITLPAARNSYTAILP
jgi:hypothetical protein